ncbi:hypothetical protein VC83_08727 [Pseudogymnoascus destructans]|uniref:Uncharacterized protein n=1 Tax=Pseudogymnoascus destructans TaxID=655981 RepID=A0A176ZZ11_9PEZI|nr:uncharacterized protein VC83_08727 [Pseudogymnoascus destructans]OAF55087.1 hypothetical protein VC83_08727 [Pseudogymnoascus destructans]
MTLFTTRAGGNTITAQGLQAPPTQVDSGNQAVETEDLDDSIFRDEDPVAAHKKRRRAAQGHILNCRHRRIVTLINETKEPGWNTVQMARTLQNDKSVPEDVHQMFKAFEVDKLRSESRTVTNLDFVHALEDKVKAFVKFNQCRRKVSDRDPTMMEWLLKLGKTRQGFSYLSIFYELTGELLNLNKGEDVTKNKGEDVTKHYEGGAIIYDIIEMFGPSIL